MLIRLAQIDDVSALASLEKSQLEAELSQRESGMMQGQAFSADDLTKLINQYWIVVAESDGKIIGYVIAGSWAFFQSWPIYRRLLNCIQQHSIDGRSLSQTNSCQYGPIWISQKHRGSGVFQALVNHLKSCVKAQYPFMLTFIAEDNERSFAAHTQKVAMQVVDYFDFDGRDYYLLATTTD